MHCDYLLINGGKMSKSLGNAYLVTDLMDKGYDPLSLKMMCYTAHYRNKLNFTWEALDSSQNALVRLKEGYQKHKNGTDEIDQELINEYKSKFLEAINDDLNMPMAMSVVWDVIKNPNKSNKLADVLLDFDRVLGLRIEEPIYKKTKELPEEIKTLIEQRKKARQEKDWETSDKLRDELNSKGYIVKDSKDGMEVEYKGQ